MVLTRAMVLGMGPEAYERMWRGMLLAEYADAYRRVDALGLDAVVGTTGFQVYHHQGGAWPVIQRKFRDDFSAVQSQNRFRLSTWVFITSFEFRHPDHIEWLDEQIRHAQPLRVLCWQTESLDIWTSRHATIARQFAGMATPTQTLNVVGNPAVVIGPGGIQISGRHAVLLGTNAIQIVQQNYRH